MGFDRIDKYKYPKGLVGVCGDSIVVTESKTGGIIFECEKTGLGVLCFADEVSNIIRMRCLSLGDDGICVSGNGPVDEIGNKVCDIITQIKK